MTREFLEGLQVGELPLPEAVVDAILQAHTESWQEKLDQTTQAHAAAMKKLQLDCALREAVTAHQGKNVKAITALLDREALEKEADPFAAANQAVAQVKKENGYLFAAATPAPYAPTAGTENRQIPIPQTLAGALRERFENK